MRILENLAKQLIRTQGTRKATEQLLGARWGWLAELRGGIERNDSSAIATTLLGSGLSAVELRVLATGATSAAAAREESR